jgi:hypothetical protein
MKDLNFPEFSRLIARDQIIAFRYDINTLFYNVRDYGYTRYSIKDERAWKTGIETIY